MQNNLHVRFCEGELLKGTTYLNTYKSIVSWVRIPFPPNQSGRLFFFGFGPRPDSRSGPSERQGPFGGARRSLLCGSAFKNAFKNAGLVNFWDYNLPCSALPQHK
jgi:hypothetical protein